MATRPPLFPCACQLPALLYFTTRDPFAFTAYSSCNSTSWILALKRVSLVGFAQKERSRSVFDKRENLGFLDRGNLLMGCYPAPWKKVAFENNTTSTYPRFSKVSRLRRGKVYFIPGSFSSAYSDERWNPRRRKSNHSNLWCTVYLSRGYMATFGDTHFSLRAEDCSCC